MSSKNFPEDLFIKNSPPSTNTSSKIAMDFQANVIFPATSHANTIPSTSKSADAAIRTCGEHPNGITINYVTVSSICNRARCVIGSRRAAVGAGVRNTDDLHMY